MASISWGQTGRHRDGVKYMAEHLHLLDVESCEVPPGQGKPWRALTGAGEGQL